ncbi:MAG: DNA-dependent RNA polymerase subunit Rpb9 [Harvfovirus sp.]|uniref:DNA-dependent RNA polymerase subunit Rpb9 n=1 Tax=Harvfovirus sp. TaxID=2487768 RepID=A0A3G5A1X9_9VIRU|nr:MAG: DNA-dependent RNA polymerase subunit Rpb9 [Harvfovirus sp.]
MSYCPTCKTTLIPVLQEQVEKSGDEEVTPETVSNSSAGESAPKAGEKKEVAMTTINKYVFRCSNCGYTQEMLPGVLLASRAPQKSSIDFSDPNKFKDMIHDKTLPIDRKYICPNESCPSVNDYALREAVWFKPSRFSYGIVYICKACQTMW